MSWKQWTHQKLIIWNYMIYNVAMLFDTNLIVLISCSRVEVWVQRCIACKFDMDGFFFQLRFFYHMFGRSIGSLNVYTRETVTGPMKKIWSKSGNVGDFFERVDLTINENKPFQVNTASLSERINHMHTTLFFLFIFWW